MANIGICKYKLQITMCNLFFPGYTVDIKPDPRDCTLDTPSTCHANASCTPVTPQQCSSMTVVMHRCECNPGYTGDGINCTGE